MFWLRNKNLLSRYTLLTKVLILYPNPCYDKVCYKGTALDMICLTYVIKGNSCVHRDLMKNRLKKK